jgi:membrane associated rhomboid family serine protease
MCAREAPQPWYPRRYIRQTGADPDQVDAVLQMLALEGLVEKAPGTLETGAGVTLTPLGQQVVDDPALMDRLRQGLPVRPDDAGSVVRNSLRSRARPVVTQALVGLNVLVFLYGAWVASQKVPSLAGTYLSLMPWGEAYRGLLEELGSAVAGKIRDDQWWRLMTCTFLHAGLLHIGMNMYALYVLGSFAEQVWGRWRFLVIYLIAGWGGSCLAMAYNPGTPVVGASGAICGVLGAVIVWILLCGKYLPAEMARRGRNQLLLNVVLIVFISLLPGVSGWGHLGGGLAGAAAALVLHWQRFGAAVLRWAALLLLLAVPVISYAYMAYAWKGRAQARLDRAKEKEEPREDNEEPRKKVKKKKLAKKDDADDKHLAAGPFLRHLGEPVIEEADALLKTCEKVPLDIQAARKDATKAKSLLASVAEHQANLKKLRQEVEKAHFQDKRIEEGRTSALDLLGECRKLGEEVTAYLKDPGRESKDRLKARFSQLDDLVDDFKKLMKKLREL